MKKLIGYIGSYTCLWLGKLLCKMMNTIPFLFIFYNFFMIYSVHIQDWANLPDGKPWKRVENK